MYFKDVIGQEEAKSFLLSQVQANKLHHANLLIGKLGYGGLALSIATARYMQCENRGPEDSCGVCSSCNKFDKLAHPDTFYSYPTFESKETSPVHIESWRKIMQQTGGYFNLGQWLDLNKKKNTKIRAEECDLIIRNFLLTSFEGRYKIQIIWMAELIGMEINKLLKIFEEPPANSVFFLICEDIESILPTVISRCQSIKLQPIGSDALKNKLAAKFPDKLTEIERYIPVSNGDYLEALELIQDAQLNMNAAVVKWNRFIVNNARAKNIDNISGMVQFIDDLSGSTKEELKTFFQFYQHFLHESFLLKYAKHCNLADDLIKVGEYFAAQFEIDQFEALQQLTDQAWYEIERNGSAKLVLMNLAIKSAKVLNRVFFEAIK